MKRLQQYLLGLVFLICASSAFAADGLKIDKTTGCRVEAPQSWGQYSVQWIGDCVAGLADGSGVLKGLGNGKVQELYYGSVSRGVLRIGVIEADKGYVAGEFSNGKAVQDGDRQSYIQAFREAVAGAKKASDFYRKRGSAASAKYYAEKASALEKQLD